MSVRESLNLRKKVRYYIALQVLVLAIIAVTAWAGLELTLDALSETREELTEELQPIHNLQFLLTTLDGLTIESQVRGHSAVRKEYQTLSERIDATLARLTGPATPLGSVDEQVIIQRVASNWRQIRQTIEPLFAPSEPFNQSRYALLEQSQILVHHAINDLEGIYNVAFAEIRDEESRALAAKLHSFILLLVVFLGSGVLMFFVNRSIKRQVIGPICRLLKATKRLGNGYFDLRIDVDQDDEMGRLCSSFNSMVERLECQHAELLMMATHDALTGLCNHGRFLHVLDAEVNRATRYQHPLSLMLLDVDYFKDVNDQYGHVMGDQVLHRLAETLQTQIRPSDTAARYGGEEFAVILPETDLPEAQQMAERIRHSLSAMVFSAEDGSTFGITVSIGIARYSHEHHPLSRFVGAADRALYSAKNGGRNRLSVERVTPRGSISLQ